MRKSVGFSNVLFVGFVLGLNANCQSQEHSQAATPIPRTLKIEWSLGTDLPQGFQDSDGGFIGDQLVTACGFCSGGLVEDNQRKPGKYPRGFLTKVWTIDPDAVNARWSPLPDFPGAARQGLSCVAINGSLLFWGGFSYDAPFCYADGWKLSRDASSLWQWEALPALPYVLTTATFTAIGTRIYAFGGADYDGVKGFYTESDRVGLHKRMGSQLLILDTAKLKEGWKLGPECPGTGRFVHAAQAVGGKLYVLGGATGDLVREGQNYGYCTVVDNWMFDPGTQAWTRLPDLPVSSGNFPKSANLVFQNRWIILPGGHQYSYVANPDGTVRPKFGQASQKRISSGLHNDVFVFDTKANSFGRADHLPIDNNLPMTVVRGDRIYLIGGETGGGEIDGNYYGHHPDLLLIGRISEISTDQK